jgi:hypothetical protein
MTIAQGMSGGAACAVSDLLDNVARIEAGQEVLLLAHVDGLYGSDNLVDEQAIAWIQSGIHQRGAHASVLWIDEQGWSALEGRIPPVLKAAMAGCDVFINHSFNLVTEDMRVLREHFTQLGIRYVRNFATTAALLNTPWAQTPSELLAEIRYQAGAQFNEGDRWRLTDVNGTELEGTVAATTHEWFPTYACYREGGGGYLPWPEWVYPPINLAGTCGELVFDRMLSTWTRAIGVPPFLASPIRIVVEDGRIVGIEGGEEATKLRSFLERMALVEGESVYEFSCLHGGIHPQAAVSAQECPNVNYRRLIEHAHTSNIHMHIGAEPQNRTSPYWLHITGDVRTATLTVGETVVYEAGRLRVLDNPKVLAVAEKYPDRPGLPQQPSSRCEFAAQGEDEMPYPTASSR